MQPASWSSFFRTSVVRRTVLLLDPGPGACRFVDINAASDSDFHRPQHRDGAVALRNVSKQSDDPLAAGVSNLYADSLCERHWQPILADPRLFLLLHVGDVTHHLGR